MAFAGGTNIAMKVPPHQWDETVRFYRDVLGLREIANEPTEPPSTSFEFGPNRLWVDRVDTVSQAELWLEIRADDTAAAAEHLAAAGIARRDEIEALPDGTNAFWISSPASIIHLVALNSDQETRQGSRGERP